MSILVLYGTESGNAELVADDIADSLGDRFKIHTRDMSDATVSELLTSPFVLVVCSTHGDGELPSSAIPFAEALDRDKPDLTGMRYAVFGLGDSSYDTYSRGSELIDERFRALGGERIGDYARHDASSREIASDLATVWARDVVDIAYKGWLKDRI